MKIYVNKIVKKIKKFLNVDKIETAIVTGSGVDIQNLLNNKKVINYTDFHMPKSSVSGHTGKFIYGFINDKPVILASRYHYYEFNDMNIIRLPYEILNKLGVKNIILQTSSAAVNETFNIGDVVNIVDHINFTGNNPLINSNNLKFVNMSDCYNNDLITKVRRVYNDLDIDYKKSTHIQFSGPNYETKAEIKLAKSFGADTISMSLVYDDLICNYLGINVVAFAIITNISNNKNIKTLTHDEVLLNCKKASLTFSNIVENLINIL